MPALSVAARPKVSRRGGTNGRPQLAKLLRIREYIINNPSSWDTDIDNPETWTSDKTVDLEAHYASLWRES